MSHVAPHRVSNLTVPPTHPNNIVDTRPDKIVEVQDFFSKDDKAKYVQFDIRYHSYYNFVGRPIAGYHASKCFLTDQAAQALKTVIEKLEPFGLTLKIYDGYRPHRAVQDFIQWSAQDDQQEMKQDFYPDLEKQSIFKDGYLIEKSGHSRGSTVDLTIVPIDSSFPICDSAEKLKTLALTPKKAGQLQTLPDNSLDFGTPFDYFSLASHPSWSDLTPQQKANRVLLQTLMKQAGFLPITTEWWHFYLANEPYPDTYFDFPIT